MRKRRFEWVTSFMSFMKHWDSKTFQSNTPILSLLIDCSRSSQWPWPWNFLQITWQSWTFHSVQREMYHLSLSLSLFYRAHCLICKQHLDPGRTSVSFETWLWMLDLFIYKGHLRALQRLMVLLFASGSLTKLRSSFRLTVESNGLSFYFIFFIAGNSFVNSMPIKSQLLMNALRKEDILGMDTSCGRIPNVFTGACHQY